MLFINYSNDIYFFIKKSLKLQGFNDIREVPIDTLKETIRKYIMFKLRNKDEKIYEQDNIDLDILFQKYENYIEKRDKPIIMGNFIHCILSYISLIQGWEIVWEIDDKQDEPIFKCNFEPGKIDRLVTKENINYLATFNFCLEEARKLKEERTR
ncbi:MAG: hypothetical protein E7163_04955 [Firmicutes bacterium]|nr:hypothetical protein [Bacillota bacterium]